ncbi:MAG: efflux RND transporter permease subunit [Proteobacteria bacterium]|nr:efflux RND transporter permease subunit [Pseudomonadota bacterium]
MNLAELSIRNRVTTLVMAAVLLFGGGAAYDGMSRLEDPEFTIKEALVVTPYSGASAAEVEEEVTDELELAVQQLSQLKEIESKSDRGLSTLTVTIKDRFDKNSLPQVWDELRRKVGDAQGQLPPGAGPSIVVDDYGDVWGVFVAVHGDEYSYAELKTVVDLLRRELVLVEDVAKIETFGERSEAIYIEPDRDRMAQLGVPPDAIFNEVRQRNLVSYAGRVRVGDEFITVSPTGQLSSVEEFESILITPGSARQIYLRDVAAVRRGYVEPQQSLIRYDGQPAIGLGISTVSGGNVVTMGQALEKRVQELLPEIPLGIEVGIISLQSQAVTTAIEGFTTSLVQAVAIVIAVLLVFMGPSSGLLIGFILVLTIVGSFIFLAPWGVALERISLGALIIALGMLVDNAIVIVDGILIKLQRGVDRERAAIETASQSAMPLFGATVIAVLAFAAIGTSDDNTGEFCRSLFQVVLVSLLFSWFTALTVTPLLGVMFLKAPSGGGDDPYASPFYRRYKGFLTACIRRRGLTLAVVVAIFAAAVWGFGFVERSFFPPSTRPQFMVDLWLPQGTHIDETTAQVAEIEEYVRGLDGVTHVTSLVGQGGLRFLLTYTPEKLNSAYAQLLVDVEDGDVIDGLQHRMEADLAERYPDTLSYVFKFELGPGSNGKIRARLGGNDPAELRRIAAQVKVIFEDDQGAKGVRQDWRQQVKILEPEIAEEEANAIGIQRDDVALALLQGFEGARAGVYREGDLLLPVIVRAPEAQRTDVASVRALQIWSPAAGREVPLRQVVSDFQTRMENEIIYRRDRKRTITVYADPVSGPASVLFARLRPQVEALVEASPGITLEWGGEYEDSGNAQEGIAASIPFFVLAMLLITIGLFNSLRQPAVIWLCVPLAVIGVTAGLLITRQPFGFMALLGFLSLMGMLIKNAIVLIDQINLELADGKPLLDAIVDSGASRLRPVAMAASTTALGMIPLLFDAFFVAMAVTIIGGLLFATVLTMVVVPVLFALFYGAPTDGGAAAD